jgi:L-iditol 2-dehydrogenase
LPEPRILGHELSGITADGTPVAVHPNLGCGHCRQCTAGRINRCPDRRSIGTELDGGFAEWLAVPAASAVGVPDIPLELAPLLEPLACCHSALAQVGPDRIGTAAVVGAGAMGILTLWVLQAHGVRVVMCQRSPERRAVAQTLGADAVVGPNDDPAVALGAPVDAIIVTAPGAAALRWALEHVTIGGTVHSFAGTPGGAQIDANSVHYRHLTLLGGTGSTLADFHAAIDLVRAGRIALGRLPRSTITLDALPAALTDPPDGRYLRTVVDMGANR